MRKLTKEQLEQLRNKISVIKGIYKASKGRLFLNNEVRAGDIRRYNNYLDKIKEITHDNEFINFSVSIMTAWANDRMVDGTEFNSKINQFFEYIKVAYNLGGNKEGSNIWIYYTNPFWLLWRLIIFIWRHKVISSIVLAIGLLATDYAMAWRNIKILWNFIKSLF